MSIKKAREQRGVTQAELAKALQVDQSTVCLWETGKTSPRAKLLPRIAKQLNCSVDDLLLEEDTATYQAWKEELAKSGKTPEELLAQYEAAGMTDYVKQVRSVILRMEGSA